MCWWGRYTLLTHSLLILAQSQADGYWVSLMLAVVTGCWLNRRHVSGIWKCVRLSNSVWKPSWCCTESWGAWKSLLFHLVIGQLVMLAFALIWLSGGQFMNGSCFLHRVSRVMESHGSFDTIFQAWKLMESNCILMEFFLQQPVLLTITYVNGLSAHWLLTYVMLFPFLH